MTIWANGIIGQFRSQLDLKSENMKQYSRLHKSGLPENQEL